MDFEEFMRLFHGAVAAVENGEVAEVELEAQPEDFDRENALEVRVTIRRQQWRVGNSGAEE